MIPAAEFFTGLWETALDPDEMLTGSPLSCVDGPMRFCRTGVRAPRGDFAIASAVVAVEVDIDDRVSRCGIGLLGQQ